jgi:hypothetical protein
MIDVQRDNIRQLMAYNDTIPICSINEPALVIMPHCKNLIASLKYHRFDMSNASEDDKYKDPSDALKICEAGMAGVEYKSPTDEGKKKPFLLQHDTNNFSHGLR